MDSFRTIKITVYRPAPLGQSRPTDSARNDPKVRSGIMTYSVNVALVLLYGDDDKVFDKKLTSVVIRKILLYFKSVLKRILRIVLKIVYNI